MFEVLVKDGNAKVVDLELQIEYNFKSTSAFETHFKIEKEEFLKKIEVIISLAEYYETKDILNISIVHEVFKSTRKILPFIDYDWCEQLTDVYCSMLENEVKLESFVKKQFDIVSFQITRFIGEMQTIFEESFLKPSKAKLIRTKGEVS